MSKRAPLPLEPQVEGPPAVDEASAEPEVHDRVLMARIAAGDEASFEALLNRYWEQVVSFSGRLMRSAEAGEDIAQEVFVRVWQHRDEWNPSGSVCAYVFRIARNLAVDEHRKRDSRRRLGPEVRALHSQAELPLRAAERSELKKALEAAIDQLPARRREVFLLVHYEGLSYRDVAGVMGISVSTVANQLSAALVELRRELRSFLQAGG